MVSGTASAPVVVMLMSSNVIVSRFGKEFVSLGAGVAEAGLEGAAGCACAVEAYRKAAIDGIVAGNDLAHGCEMRVNEEVLCDTVRR